MSQIKSYIGLLWHVINEYRLAEQNEYCAEVLAMLRAGMISEGLAKVILWDIDPDIQRAIDFPQVLHRLPESDQFYAHGCPDFVLGVLDNGMPFGVRLLDRSRHILIVGLSGSGKTYLLLVLLYQIHEHNQRHPDRAIVCIVWERKGKAFSALARKLGWKVFSIHHDLRLAQGPPEGVPPRIWNHINTEMLTSRSGLIAAGGCYAAIVDLILPILNPRPTDRLLWPTPQLCLDVARAIPWKMVASKQQYLDSLIQVLDTLVRASGDLFAFDGLEIERDLIRTGQSAVIDNTNTRPSWVRQYEDDLQAGAILYGRMHRADIAGRQVLLVFDDADEDLTVQAEADYEGQNLPPMPEIAKRGRELNISSAFVLSHLGKTTQYITSNVSYQYHFLPADSRSLSESVNTLLLPEGGELTLRSLKSSQCLYIESLGAWPHAVRGHINPLPFDLDTSDLKYDTVPFVPGKRLSQMPELQAHLKRLIGQQQSTVLNLARQQQAGFSEHGRRLLNAKPDNLYAPVAWLWKQIGDPGFSVQMAVRAELVQRELAAFEEPRIGRANVALMWLTEKGCQYLGVPQPEKPGHQDLAHHHACNWVRMDLESRGFQARCEWPVPGDRKHNADVGCMIDGQLHVWEVLHKCQMNLLSHLSACFLESRSVVAFTILAFTKNHLAELRQLVAAEPSLRRFSDRIRFEVIEPYMRRRFP